LSIPQYIFGGSTNTTVQEGKIMEKKLECPNGIPEENCDHAPHCNVWKLREKAKNQA